MFEQLLAALARSLDAQGIPYMIIGGQAVLLYGEPRLTRDVDLTVARTPEQLPAILEVAEQVGLVPLVEPEPFVQDTFVLPCTQPDTGIRVDFVFSSSEYEREAFTRAQPVEIAGQEVRFASLEDVLVQKIIAGRPRDLEDARSILLKNPEADLSYVRRWLSIFSEALAADFARTFEDLLQDVQF